MVRAVHTSGAELVLASVVLSQPGLHALLMDLRSQLPKEVRMIVGGAAVHRLPKTLRGIEILDEIEALRHVL